MSNELFQTYWNIALHTPLPDIIVVVQLERRPQNHVQDSPPPDFTIDIRLLRIVQELSHAISCYLLRTVWRSPVGRSSIHQQRELRFLRHSCDSEIKIPIA